MTENRPHVTYALGTKPLFGPGRDGTLVVRWPESHCAFDDPGLQEIDLGAWVIPVDGRPDARAAAFVASILADQLRNLQVDSHALSFRHEAHE